MSDLKSCLLAAFLGSLLIIQQQLLSKNISHAKRKIYIYIYMYRELYGVRLLFTLSSPVYQDLAQPGT